MTATFSTHHFLDPQVVDDRFHLQALDHAGRIFDSLALPVRTPARWR